MSSEAKRAASRQNALKSTGPRTVRGKTKSKFNAVKYGIYAGTPVLPGEDEAAYCELETQNYEHFAPINPVEDFLVRQITAEEWKLRRIDKAEYTLHMRMRKSQIERLIQSLSMSELCHLRADVENSSGEQPEEKKHLDVAAACDAKVLPSAYGGLAETARELTTFEKKDLVARFQHITNMDNTMLDALVPSTEISPQQCLTQERRAAVRVYIAYVDKLTELQEARRTVTLMPAPAEEKETTPLSKTRHQKPLQPKKAANQNRSGTDSRNQKKSANAARTRPIPKDLGDSPTEPGT